MIPLAEIPKQLLNEASFARFVDYHTPKGYIAISACCGAKVMFGVDVATPEQVKQVDRMNRQQTEQLRTDMSHLGLTFFPVYGTYKETVENPETGETYEDIVDEASFLVFPRRDQNLSPAEVAAQLLSVGKQLARKYNQQSFLYKAPGEHQRAYYITPRGQVDMSFDGVRLNDMSQDFATRFVKQTDQGFDQKADRRFSYINSTPDLAWKDEGEVLSRQQEKRAASPEVLAEQALLARFAEPLGVVNAPGRLLTEAHHRVGPGTEVSPVRWCHTAPESMGQAVSRHGEVFYRL